MPPTAARRRSRSSSLDRSATRLVQRHLLALKVYAGAGKQLVVQSREGTVAREGRLRQHALFALRQLVRPKAAHRGKKMGSISHLGSRQPSVRFVARDRRPLEPEELEFVVDCRTTLLHACKKAATKGIVGLRARVQLGEQLQAIAERRDPLEFCDGCRQLFCFQERDVSAVTSRERCG